MASIQDQPPGVLPQPPPGALPIRPPVPGAPLLGPPPRGIIHPGAGVPPPHALAQAPPPMNPSTAAGPSPGVGPGPHSCPGTGDHAVMVRLPNLHPPTSMSEQRLPTSMGEPHPPNPMAHQHFATSVSGDLRIPVSMADQRPPSSMGEMLPPNSVANFRLPNPMSELRPPNPMSELRPPNPMSELRPPNPMSELRPPNPMSEIRPPNPMSELRPPNSICPPNPMGDAHLPPNSMGNIYFPNPMGGPRPPVPMGGPRPPVPMGDTRPPILPMGMPPRLPASLGNPMLPVPMADRDPPATMSDLHKPSLTSDTSVSVSTSGGEPHLPKPSDSLPPTPPPSSMPSLPTPPPSTMSSLPTPPPLQNSLSLPIPLPQAMPPSIPSTSLSTPSSYQTSTPPNVTPPHHPSSVSQSGHSPPPSIAETPPTQAPPTNELVEVWLEHQTVDGRVYYSDPRTQKTSWDKPPNARVISQPPTGTVPPTGSLAGGGGGGGAAAGGGVSGATGTVGGGDRVDGTGGGPPRSVGERGPPALPPFPMPNLPVGVSLVPQRVWSEHRMPDGKAYYYNKVTHQSVWDKPRDFDLVMPLPSNLGAPSQGPGPAAVARGNMASTDQQPPVGREGGGGKMAQPLLPTPGGQPLPIPIPISLPISVPPLGNILRAVAGSASSQDETIQKETNTTANLPTILPPGGSSGMLPPPVLHATVNLASTTIATPKPILKVAKKEEPKGPRPIQSTPVPGTPWSVVFTTDERMFFFDASNRKSVWKLPLELVGNQQVVKIVGNPPWGPPKTEAAADEPPLSKKIRLDESGNGLQQDQQVPEEEEAMDTEVQSGERKVEVDVPMRLTANEEASSEREKQATELRSSRPLEDRQEDFKKMLREREVSAFSTWEKELPKFVFDPRYLLLTPKERREVFDEFVREHAEEEMREKKAKLKEKKERFVKLMEEARITTRTTFNEFTRQSGRDERFKSVEKMRDREALFNEFVSGLKRSSRQKEEQLRQQSRNKMEKVKSDFLAMLSEEHSLTLQTQWKKVKGLFHHDPRYRGVETSAQREDWFNEFIKSLGRDERQDRIAASMREREREVQMSRSAQEKEWDKEKDQLRKTEAHQHFKALLVDMVRNSEASWTDTKRSLRKDYRWDLADLLELADKEKMFREHVEQLSEKKRLQFRRLLEETHQITLIMSWKKAKKLIKEDPRYKNYTDSDHKREAEYQKYLRDKLHKAKNEFRALLKETKLITYKTKSMMRESEKHLKEITDVLQNDARYLNLEHYKDERDDILMRYINDLHCRGPPPPPTASNPSERLRK